MLGFLRTQREKIDAVRTPTAVSLLLLACLMAGTLALPKRPEGKKLHASELEPLVLQPVTPGKPISLSSGPGRKRTQSTYVPPATIVPLFTFDPLW